jgi:predicted Rdx family selenoprotein
MNLQEISGGVAGNFKVNVKALAAIWGRKNEGAYWRGYL